MTATTTPAPSGIVPLPGAPLGRADRVAERLITATLRLSPGVQRVLAGRRVVIDGQVLDVDIQLLQRLQRLAREPELADVPAALGRARMLRQARLAGGHQPIGEVRDLVAAGLPARLYVPQPPRVDSGVVGAAPLLVFLHGGGFMYGDLDSHDAACRFLAQRAGVRVLAVDYRRAPEHPFPAAYDDAWAAYCWAVEHAADLGVDPQRIGVGGDSAGGNLAAGVALAAASAGLPCAVQLLLYPVTARARDTRSAALFRQGFYLTGPFMNLADRCYLADGDRSDPRYAPLLADLPALVHDAAAPLAPVLIHTAGFDPLRDEGEAYAEKLRAAGVPVLQRRFSGQIHGFLNMVGIGRTSVSAVTLVAADLRAALGPVARSGVGEAASA